MHAFARMFDPMAMGATAEAGNVAAAELISGLREVVANRQRTQRDDDLIGALVASRDDRAQLTADEVVYMCFLLFGAGHETTVNLIGNAVDALFKHPEQLAIFRGSTTPERRRPWRSYFATIRPSTSCIGLRWKT